MYVDNQTPGRRRLAEVARIYIISHSTVQIIAYFVVSRPSGITVRLQIVHVNGYDDGSTAAPHLSLIEKIAAKLQPTERKRVAFCADRSCVFDEDLWLRNCHD